ncbi:MAG TPA: glycosyltransferase family 2 protein [Candidatus Binatia bacterium]|nr:glycosyltransferase family 2 protein [Candidatus Binatia bacterium]
MIKVAVIVVTYNSARFVDGCFGSLAAMDSTGLETAVVAIDNGSKDDTVERMKAYPWVSTAVSKENLGFAGGNNLIMRHAMEGGADYVYLLNHDTEVTPSFLTEAVQAAEADLKIGAVQSLLLLHPDKDLINSTGNAIHFLGFGYCLDYRRRLADWRPPSGEKEIAYASGAGVLYRVAALREAGLLDEELFLYHEDLDLGWRLRLMGWKNVLAPASVVHHKYEFSRSITKYYYMERNRYVVFLKNLRVWTLAVLALPLAAAEIALLAASVRSGWWREKLRVYGYFFKSRGWKHIASERKRIQSTRKVGDREIVRLFVPTIGYQEVAGPFTKYVANPLMTAAWAVLRLLIV